MKASFSGGSPSAGMMSDTGGDVVREEVERMRDVPVALVTSERNK